MGREKVEINSMCLFAFRSGDLQVEDSLSLFKNMILFATF